MRSASTPTGSPSLEYSPDGVLLATGDRNGGLFVWEAFTGREYFTPPRPHRRRSRKSAGGPTATSCASASEDGTVRLWEMENGNAIKTWGAHGGGVESVRYGRDGRIATAGRDKLVKLWDGDGNAAADVRGLAGRGPAHGLHPRRRPRDRRRLDRAGHGLERRPTARRSAQLTPNPPTLAERLDAAQKDVRGEAGGARPDGGGGGGVAGRRRRRRGRLWRRRRRPRPTRRPTSRRRPTRRRRPRRRRTRPTPPSTAAQADLQAKTVLAQALAEASAKVKDAADKAPGDAALAAAAAKARDLAGAAATEQAQAQKSVSGCDRRGDERDQRPCRGPAGGDERGQCRGRRAEAGGGGDGGGEGRRRTRRRRTRRRRPRRRRRSRNRPPRSRNGRRRWRPRRRRRRANNFPRLPRGAWLPGRLPVSHPRRLVHRQRVPLLDRRPYRGPALLRASRSFRPSICSTSAARPSSRICSRNHRE